MSTEKPFTERLAGYLIDTRPTGRVEERVCITTYTDDTGMRNVEATIVALVNGERYQLTRSWSNIDRLRMPGSMAEATAERMREDFEEVVRG